MMALLKHTGHIGGKKMGLGLKAEAVEEYKIRLKWERFEEAEFYRIYWADKNTPTMKYKCLGEEKETQFEWNRSTHIPHYFKIAAVKANKEIAYSEVLQTPVKKVFKEQIERLSRGLIAVKVHEGVFLSWRLFINEVDGYSETGLTGVDFIVYKNGQKIAIITDSTNYIDEQGTMQDEYTVAALKQGVEKERSRNVSAWKSGSNYIDIPLNTPEGGITPSGEHYTYTANDMSVGDVNGDGEYEYIVKWDPTNSHDVSIKAILEIVL